MSKNSFFNKSSSLLMVAGIIVMIIILYFLLRPATVQANATKTETLPLLLGGILIGGVIMFLVWRIMTISRNTTHADTSHTVVESIRRVFKIVCAEGHFNELYNYEETKKYFGFIPSTKRALVIIEAKVLVGFDFEKCVWETNEETNTLKLVSFPEPEILSIEPDYKYYNFDEGILNLLNRKDLTLIQANGKKQVEMSARKSHLPRIAADQMRTILTEVVESKKWHLEDSYKITESANSIKTGLSSI
ncbi:MAG: DUF4230 domain-containing protein [Ferruginibacter sp.]